MIVKYKARWCAHGGQTIKGVHYENTYAPVVTWTTIRFLLTLALINNWHTRQVDFVLAYPQAKVLHDVYMLPPEKFVTMSVHKMVLSWVVDLKPSCSEARILLMCSPQRRPYLECLHLA